MGILTKSQQSDTTRSANLELKIQSRVTSELERLAAEEASKLKELSDSISKEAESPSSSDSDAPTLTDKLTGVAADKEKKAQLSHGSVSSEIAELKRKLEGRRKVEAVDKDVQKAKDELVQCLRINDRRPLDCWKEREAFKREVGRLEREFVERTVR
jgi:altered-inheritance-of-mitochondria protein 13